MDCAIILPGAPISVKLPPIAAANATGISNEVLDIEDLAAIPITTGIITAAVPVLDKKPDIIPVIPMMTIMSILGVLANRVIPSPIFWAIPVSKNVQPTINIAINNNTLGSIKPANASFALNTPVKDNPIATIIADIDRGIISKVNITIAKTKNNKVIIESSILYTSQLICVSAFIFYHVITTYTLKSI